MTTNAAPGRIVAVGATSSAAHSTVSSNATVPEPVTFSVARGAAIASPNVSVCETPAASGSSVASVSVTFFATVSARSAAAAVAPDAAPYVQSDVAPSVASDST